MRSMDPLQVAMTGVRMGEKYLQIFCSDATLTRGLAAKTGLSGVAALAAPDDTHARRARTAAGKEGVLIDVKVTAPADLAWDDGSFDMVVVDNTGGAFTALAPADRAATLAAAHRVLRLGGRIEMIERMTPATDADALLATAGFKPVRVLAERDHFRFVEGLKA